jgi:hypothetical protein
MYLPWEFGGLVSLVGGRFPRYLGHRNQNIWRMHHRDGAKLCRASISERLMLDRKDFRKEKQLWGLYPIRHRQPNKLKDPASLLFTYQYAVFSSRGSYKYHCAYLLREIVSGLLLYYCTVIVVTSYRISTLF